MNAPKLLKKMDFGMRVDVTYIWYSEDGRCYLLDVFYGFTQKLLKSSFKIKEIPDCSIVTLPEDLTSRRFDCSKFTLFTNNDSQYIWIKFSSIVTIYNIMQEFIQYRTLMQNDSVESLPQILEEKYVCIHDLESLQNVVSYAFEDYAMHKMITVLVYVRSSEFNIPWRLDDKMNILLQKIFSYKSSHQWMVLLK